MLLILAKCHEQVDLQKNIAYEQVLSVRATIELHNLYTFIIKTK